MKKFIISGELFSALMLKAGVKDSETFKKLLETEGDSELTQEQFNELTAQMLNMQDAVNNPNIVNQIKANVFQPTEDRLKELLTGAGLKEDDVKKLLDGKPNADKITAAFEKVKELTKNDPNQTQREQQFKDIKKQLEDSVNEWKTKYETESQARAFDREDAALTSYLSNPDNFKLRSDLPIATQLKLAKSELREQLQAKGAKLVADQNGGLKVVYANEPEQEFYEPGAASAYDLKAGTTQVLTNAGLLNMQPGNVTKTDLAPNPAGGGQTVDSHAANSFAANHAALAASLAEQQ